MQPETFSGSQFPADKQGHAFVAQSGATWGTGPQGDGKTITEFLLDANGARVSGPTHFVEYVGSGKGSVVGLASGPDGLYFTELYKDQDYVTPIDRGARVFRVRFVGGAAFEADITSGTPNLAVKFTDTSNMPGITDWLWDFGDGETSTGQNPTHVYREEESFSVSLRVTGAGGAVKVMSKDELISVRTDRAPGLQGQYYNSINFTDLALTRTDETINFNWGTARRIQRSAPDSFSVRWTGTARPQFTETYTFYAISDDGIRRFANNQLVIDGFIDQSPTEHTGQIALVGGQEYDIRVEYYENGGGAEARLQWSSASQPREVVPGSRLSSGTPFNQPPRVLHAAWTGNSVEITFHEDVSASLSLNDLALVHESHGPVDLSGASLQFNLATDTAKLSLPGLAAGIFSLTLLSNGAVGGVISDAAGALLDGNADNVGGDDYVFEFLVAPSCGGPGDLVGDSDCDNDLELDDLNNVRNNFGISAPGVPGDTNGDSAVDLDDLNNVRNHFGETAPAQGQLSWRTTQDIRAAVVPQTISALGVDQMIAARDALFESPALETRQVRLLAAKKSALLALLQHGK